MKCHWLTAKWNWNLNEQIIVFCLHFVLIIMMLIIIMLSLLSKTQNYMSLYQQKANKNYQNSIRINIKQRVRRVIQRIDIDIFSKLTSWFVYTKMAMLKGINMELMIYKKILSTNRSSSIETTFMTNHLILI